ncbi:unnamed protein product [Mytilus edulis]|uniref:Uncharacterized protein n=1 Tax=Mytilus edulis TaxID=6550 RepID=A0A8S3PWZ1_MYTED|nr:unnamed protein product [Mytilus edulis]
MLIKNEDTADGLENGVMGTVISIKDFLPNSLPSNIFIHFDNERVRRNAKVQKIISGKRCVGLKPSSEDIPFSDDVAEEPTQSFQIVYHNIQGLQTHAEDLKHNPDFRRADYICLTETWTNQELICFEMMGYDGFHLPRSLAFEDDNSYYSSLKEMQHGGVCVFYKLSTETEICNLASNLECIVFKISSKNILVATVYRTQKYNLGKFLENLEILIYILKGGCTVFNFMSSKGFRQLVDSPTTEGGTLIDHVYVKGCLDTQIAIIPTYYSYHEALKIVIPYD